MSQPTESADPPTESTVLLSYDVAGASRSLSVRVAHLIFGRSDDKPEGPLRYVDRPGVVWIGQSVLLMPSTLAEELATKLRALGASVTPAPILIAHHDLDAFQPRRRPRKRRVRMLPES